MIDTKTINPAERQSYVPAEVKVIDITARRVLCVSPGSVNNPWGGSGEEGI